jgi:hypothetical protein
MAQGCRQARFFVTLALSVSPGVVGIAFGAPAQSASEPVAGTPVTPPRLTSVEPRDPYRSIAPGLLARTRYVADRTGPYTLEVWDLMVGPGKTSEKARLPGAAVVEVRSGTGILSSGGKSVDLRLGATAPLAEAADFSLGNTDKEAPLILRATLIRKSPR